MLTYKLPEGRSENVISNVELLHFSWMLDEQVWAATNFEIDYNNETIEFSTNPDWAAREIHGSLDNNALSGSAADEFIYGYAGDDEYYFAYQGFDTIYDGDGDDTVIAETRSVDGEGRFRKLYQTEGLRF